jgi:ketosteroid isomerase-like protein
MRIALLGALLAISFVVGSSSTAQPLTDEQQILQLEQEWSRALKKEDRGALDRILHPDFTFIEPDGSVLSRKAYLADRSNNPAIIDSFEGTKMKVVLFGTTALVTGLSKCSEHRQGKSYRFQLRWKEIWLKGPTGWKVRAGQATPVNSEWNKSFVVPTTARPRAR